jgi:hypothetical protein
MIDPFGRFVFLLASGEGCHVIGVFYNYMEKVVVLVVCTFGTCSVRRSRTIWHLAFQCYSSIIYMAQVGVFMVVCMLHMEMTHPLIVNRVYAPFQCSVRRSEITHHFNVQCVQHSVGSLHEAWCRQFLKKKIRENGRCQ